MKETTDKVKSIIKKTLDDVVNEIGEEEFYESERFIIEKEFRSLIHEKTSIYMKNKKNK